MAGDLDEAVDFGNRNLVIVAQRGVRLTEQAAGGAEVARAQRSHGLEHAAFSVITCARAGQRVAAGCSTRGMSVASSSRRLRTPSTRGGLVALLASFRVSAADIPV